LMPHLISELCQACFSSQGGEAGGILAGEVDRQQHTLEWIASENHASEAVMLAGGTAFTNKYAEG